MQTNPGEASSEGKAAPVLPNPTLPKGGGAISSIGENFVSNPQMGTATFSIPLNVTAASIAAKISHRQVC